MTTTTNYVTSTPASTTHKSNTQTGGLGGEIVQALKTHNPFNIEFLSHLINIGAWGTYVTQLYSTPDSNIVEAEAEILEEEEKETTPDSNIAEA